MTVSNHQRPVPEIIGDLFVQFAKLLRKETQLARAEISENVASVGRGLGQIVGGAVLLIPALVILLQAGVAALNENVQLAPYWSSLIVGGAVLILGLILLLVGVRHLKAENLMPNKTVEQLRRDATVARQQVENSSEHRRAA